jgi:hypothetical protein
VSLKRQEYCLLNASIFRVLIRCSIDRR